MNIEEAIAWIMDEKSSLERAPYLNGCQMTEDWQRAIDVYDIALSALRAQASCCKKCNDPLTLDELRQMDGDRIYIQFIGACKGFYDDEYAPYYGKRQQYVQKYNGMLRACDLPLKYYGESWLAYRRKPEQLDKVSQGYSQDKPMPNADRIRSMSDDELADFLCSIAYARANPWSDAFVKEFCASCPNPEYTLDDGRRITLHECDFVGAECPHGTDIIWWLKEKEETNAHVKP